ncbi:hypothetical protein [Enterobacter roggenkampii]|uniref:hypothetical protein n=1 Tax=Enterobacter roggenkampii TaxID=1812935 RepID=UPI0020321F5D|nr:hypothetical protein [Enterobacter roggenkampii]WCF42110.1 hypothetical protein KK030_08785 [Enterobacter roggenkampii]
MSTITKERAQQIFLGNGPEPTASEERELARIALASIEAVPVAYMTYKGYLLHAADPKLAEYSEPTPLYDAPPAPVALPSGYSDFEEIWSSSTHPLTQDDEMKDFAWDIWNACRAAMFQGADGNSPVIPDDVRRMDWLVSKTVDVREPMVYGSHSLFWSQTITDEEDDYHATKLREQIDAAMAAEQAAAPQQEVR